MTRSVFFLKPRSGKFGINKTVLFLVFVMAVLPLAAQQETMDTYCSWSTISDLVNKRSFYKDIFKDVRHPDTEKALAEGWKAFTDAYSLEGLPQGMIAELFEPAALEKINSTMGNIGNGLALLQILGNYANKDTLSAVSNSIKTSMFYAMGTWGWKALKIAGAGLQVFDYMLTSFGEVSVGKRQEALREAYFIYYEKGPGKRDLTAWRAIIEKLEGDKAVESEISAYLNAYFTITDDEIDKKISGGLITTDEIANVKKQYLEERLLPYLAPLFQRLREEARQEKLNDLSNKMASVAEHMNEQKKFRIYLNAPEEERLKCKGGIQVRINGEYKLYVHAPIAESGYCDLGFTRYSLILNKVDSARAVLRHDTGNGPVYVYQPLDLRKNRTTVYFELPGETEEGSAESNEETEEVKDPPSSPKEPGSFVLKKTMSALLTTNNVPLEVTIRQTHDSNTDYIATIENKTFPKGNVLTINKLTQEMTWVYKLKGPFAPELICKGIAVAPNIYSGIIVTHDANAVEVGTFSLILFAK